MNKLNTYINSAVSLCEYRALINNEARLQNLKLKYNFRDGFVYIASDEITTKDELALIEALLEENQNVVYIGFKEQNSKIKSSLKERVLQIEGSNKLVLILLCDLYIYFRETGYLRFSAQHNKLIFSNHPLEIAKSATTGFANMVSNMLTFYTHEQLEYIFAIPANMQIEDSSIFFELAYGDCLEGDDLSDFIASDRLGIEHIKWIFGLVVRNKCLRHKITSSNRRSFDIESNRGVVAPSVYNQFEKAIQG